MVGVEFMGGGIHGMGSRPIAIECFGRRFQTAGRPGVGAFGVCLVVWGVRRHMFPVLVEMAVQCIGSVVFKVGGVHAGDWLRLSV
mmetsp:Transcript_40595/g.66630  ORF Transcript_40595/g.66630 Transcript_40595/m.66630 type:complete len:85 (-) Transcript_40595:388-642(-)